MGDYLETPGAACMGSDMNAKASGQSQVRSTGGSKSC